MESRIILGIQYINLKYAEQMAELGCNGSGPSDEAYRCQAPSHFTLQGSVFPLAMLHGAVYFLGSRNVVRSVCVCALWKLRVVSRGNFVIMVCVYVDTFVTVCSLDSTAQYNKRFYHSFIATTTVYYCNYATLC